MRAETDEKYQKMLLETIVAERDPIARYGLVMKIIEELLVETGHNRCSGGFQSMMENLLEEILQSKEEKLWN